MTNYINPISFWEAGQVAITQDKAIRRLSWGPRSFVKVCQGQVLEADKFWIPENREAAKLNGGALIVNPRFSFCDGVSTDMGWLPTAVDMFATDWVTHPTNLMLVDAKKDHTGVHLWYALMAIDGNLGGNVWFTVYDNILTNPNIKDIVVISAAHDTSWLLKTVIEDMKGKYDSDLSNAHTNIVNASSEITKSSDITFKDYIFNRNSDEHLDNTIAFYMDKEILDTAFVIDVASFYTNIPEHADKTINHISSLLLQSKAYWAALDTDDLNN